MKQNLLVSLFVALVLSSGTLSRNVSTCMQFYRRDYLETWQIKDGSLLCNVALPLNKTGGQYGIYAKDNDFKFYTDHDMNATLNESWSTVEDWDGIEKRIGARLEVGPKIHRRFFFQLVEDDRKGLYGKRIYDWEDGDGGYTVLYVPKDDVHIHGTGAYWTLVIAFMAAFAISVGAPLTSNRLLGVGAIGFPLFTIAAVFLHKIDMDTLGAVFIYSATLLVSFGIASLLNKWNREPFLGIVLSTLAALFYALTLEAEVMAIFFGTVFVMLLYSLWLAHHHLDKSHHLTKQQIEAVALSANMLAVLMVLMISTPYFVYVRIFEDSNSPAMPSFSLLKTILPILMVLPVHVLIARHLEPNYTLAEEIADQTYSYMHAKDDIPA